MPELEYYKKELNKCKNLANQITEFINNLNTASNQYKELSSKIFLSYNVDNEKPAINNVIDLAEQKISQLLQHLNTKTIPEINERIAFLNRIISKELNNAGETLASKGNDI